MQGTLHVVPDYTFHFPINKQLLEKFTISQVSSLKQPIGQTASFLLGQITVTLNRAYSSEA
jgi:hypothetical protein